MKHNRIPLTLLGLLLFTGCSEKEDAVIPYPKGKDMEEVDRELTGKGITPLKVLDYYFYQKGERNVVLQKSSDKKSVLKSESLANPEATKAEFSLLQYGMSPFEVVSLVGLPLSYELNNDYPYRNIVGFTFRTAASEDRKVTFFYYGDYLYCCCPGYTDLYVSDYTYP